MVVEIRRFKCNKCRMTFGENKEKPELNKKCANCGSTDIKNIGIWGLTPQKGYVKLKD